MRTNGSTTAWPRARRCCGPARSRRCLVAVASRRHAALFGRGPDLGAAVAQASRPWPPPAPTCPPWAAAIAAFRWLPAQDPGLRQAVVSRGPADAPLMIIAGEAPGADEDLQGAPVCRPRRPIAGTACSRPPACWTAPFVTNTCSGFARQPHPHPAGAGDLRAVPRTGDPARVQPKILLLVGGASAKSMLKREEGILVAARAVVRMDLQPTAKPSFRPCPPCIRRSCCGSRRPKKKAWADMLMLSERLDRPERPN